MAKIVRLPAALYGAICEHEACTLLDMSCDACVSRRCGYKITTRSYGNGEFVGKYQVSHISATRKQLLALTLKWM